jgi:hypothetical protein
MSTFTVGDSVAVPCTIQEGPFPDEKLVTVDTEEGAISGFVKEANLQAGENNDEQWYLKGIVVSELDGSIIVKLLGSFFTTALGMATVARNQLRHLAA